MSRTPEPHVQNSRNRVLHFCTKRCNLPTQKNFEPDDGFDILPLKIETFRTTFFVLFVYPNNPPINCLFIYHPKWITFKKTSWIQQLEYSTYTAGLEAEAFAITHDCSISWGTNPTFWQRDSSSKYSPPLSYFLSR